MGALHSCSLLTGYHMNDRIPDEWYSSSAWKSQVEVDALFVSALARTLADVHCVTQGYS
jgi:hypothetical protein